MLALDRLVDLGGVPATLSEQTLQALDRALPRGWSHANPVDMLGDADGERYFAGMQALLADRDNDAVLAKIGSASGRARVGQCVEIPGVAVSLKKKIRQATKN